MAQVSERLLRPGEVCRMLREWAQTRGVVVSRGVQGELKGEQLYLAISKSCLLDRMVYGGERPSKTPCPVHKGVWSGCHLGWPGQQWRVLAEYDGHKPGERIPMEESAYLRAWYDAGCRCFQHRCGCTTGWNPDEHCGCPTK